MTRWTRRRAVSAPAEASASARAPASDASDEAIAPYVRMGKMGLPLGAIRHKMASDGVDEATVARALAALERTGEVVTDKGVGGAPAEGGMSAPPEPSLSANAVSRPPARVRVFLRSSYRGRALS